MIGLWISTSLTVTPSVLENSYFSNLSSTSISIFLAHWPQQEKSLTSLSNCWFCRMTKIWSEQWVQMRSSCQCYGRRLLVDIPWNILSGSEFLRASPICSFLSCKMKRAQWYQASSVMSICAFEIWGHHNALKGHYVYELSVKSHVST